MFYGKPSVFDSAEMTIDIVQNGAVATGDVYPQPSKTGVLWDAYLIKAIHWKDSQETLLYFSTAIRKTIKEKFSYDKKATWDRVKEEYIFLPVTKKNNIDFVFIEKRVSELEDECVSELEAFLQKSGFNDCNLTREEEKTLESLSSVPMKEFSMGSLFEICKGKRLTKANMKPGTIRFIGATSENNGITNKISNNSHIHPSNTITVTYNGSVGEAFYQTEQFWASDDVNVLYSKYTINENIALYFLAPIRKKGKGYAYSFKWTKEKMKEDTIWVPCKMVDGKYVCDYAFMETYISAIKKLYIARLKQEIERERKVYGQVLGKQTDEFKAIGLNKTESNYPYSDFAPLMAAEPFECYKWKGFDQSLCNSFGNDKTILIGCYKGKKYQDWIHTHNIYTIRLGDTKGSMEAYRELFDSTSLLVLYELGKPNKLSAYKIVGNKEMGKEELLAMEYPNKKPRKSYMSFSVKLLEMDLTFLIEHHLVERLIELNPENAKGTPVFIQP